jgi:iron uptake system component EfeO
VNGDGSPDVEKQPQARTSLPTKAAVCGAAALAFASLGAFYYASRIRTQSTPTGTVIVTIEDNRCTPNEISVPAGRHTFTIVNKSDRAIEWEILDGVMVIDERENIAPGLSQKLTTRLQPGSFQMTCGLLSNPRGALRVTPTDESAREAAKPPPVAFIGALAEYSVFLQLKAADMVAAAGALRDAIAANDLQAAREAYANARGPYKQIEPVARRFADISHDLDGQADYYKQAEQDPGFSGFHRIEYGLFAQGSTSGLQPVADRLVAQAEQLRDRIADLRLSPELIADSAESLLRDLAANAIPNGQDRYAHSDLQDLQDNIAGVTKLMSLIKPLAQRAAPDLVKNIDTRMAALRDLLDTLRRNDAPLPYNEVSAEQKAALVENVTALADAVGKLNDAMGLPKQGS